MCISDLATGLLGQLLALRAGRDYETLVATRIAAPLGMASTRITLTPEMKARMAAGYNASLEPAKNWDLDAGGRGRAALHRQRPDHVSGGRSWLQENAAGAGHGGDAGSSLPTTMPNLQQALGWHILQRKDRDLFWKDGGTYGFGSFIGFDPKTKVGVVVLANSFSLASGGVDDIGMHLLDTSLPVAGAPAKQRTAVAVDPKILEGYVGRYRLAPTFSSPSPGRRPAVQQATGQPKVQIFAESEKEFFLKVVDAQITFKTIRKAAPPNSFCIKTGWTSGRRGRNKAIAETTKKEEPVVSETSDLVAQECGYD